MLSETSAAGTRIQVRVLRHARAHALSSTTPSNASTAEVVNAKFSRAELPASGAGVQ